MVMHPYRAMTDENGIARVKVTKGRYDIFVSAAKYVSIATSADVTADMITRAELDPGPALGGSGEAINCGDVVR